MKQALKMSASREPSSSAFPPLAGTVQAAKQHVESILALGLCSTCYTLKRQDEEHFGGLREAVLERDGNRCRVCDASGRDKRSIIVHHRVPGKSFSQPDDLALSWLSCEGASHEDRVIGHATAFIEALARAAPERA